MASQPSIDSVSISRDCIQCDGGCGTANPSKRCTRCKAVYYCSLECQKLHWKQHKRFCLPVPETIEKLRKDDGYFNGKLQYSDEDVAFLRTKLDVERMGAGNSFETVTEDKRKTNTECSICFRDPIVAPVLVKGCCHAFCSSCLHKWQQQTQQNALDNDNNLQNSVMIMNLHDKSAPRRIRLSDPPSHCPTCRGEAGPGKVINALVAISQQCLEKVKTKGSNDRNSEEELVQVLAELDKVLGMKEQSGADFAIYASKAQILLFLSRPNDALACLAAFDRVNDDKNWKNDSMDGSAMRLLEAEAYIQLEDWETAMDRSIPKAAGAMGASQFRQIHMLQAKCQYHLGKYDQAIRAIDGILQIWGPRYRHYPGIRKYKALAEKAKGDVEAALTTMNQAVLYETPFEGALGGNAEPEASLDLYKQLLAER